MLGGGGERRSGRAPAARGRSPADEAVDSPTGGDGAGRSVSDEQARGEGGGLSPAAIGGVPGGVPGVHGVTGDQVTSSSTAITGPLGGRSSTAITGPLDGGGARSAACSTSFDGSSFERTRIAVNRTSASGSSSLWGRRGAVVST